MNHNNILDGLALCYGVEEQEVWDGGFDTAACVTEDERVYIISQSLGCERERAFCFDAEEGFD